MDNKISLIKNSNTEGLGEYYLNEAKAFFLNKDFKISYAFIKEGLDYITSLNCELKPNYITNYAHAGDMYIRFPRFSPVNETDRYYEFCYAFFLSFEKKVNRLNDALFNIECYNTTHQVLKGEDCPYGNYIEGLINSKLDNKTYTPIHNFLISKDIATSARLKYIIYKTKKDSLLDFKYEDIEGIFEAFFESPSSLCCAKELHELVIDNELYNSKIIQLREDHSWTPFLNKNDLYVTFFKDSSEFEIILQETVETKSVYLFENFTFGLSIISDFILFLRTKKDSLVEYYCSSVGISKEEEPFYDDDYDEY